MILQHVYRPILNVIYDKITFRLNDRTRKILLFICFFAIFAAQFAAQYIFKFQDVYKRQGLYTSPYIEKFNERIRFDGADISDEDLEYYGPVSYTHLWKKLWSMPVQFRFRSWTNAAGPSSFRWRSQNGAARSLSAMRCV